MRIDYTPKGVCSRKIIIDVENDIVRDVEFVGGCDGNAKGISSLVRGMSVSDVVERLDNITCGMKNTSCPAQLAEALKNNF